MNIARLIAAATLGAALLGPAFAQTEPTIDQIYQAANAGRLKDADRMIGQVLQKHPNSAKAHYVKAELAARESDAAVAREELATAERLAPGLPFAKAEAVAALRSEVGRARSIDKSPAAIAPAPAPARQVPVALVAVLFAAAAAVVYFLVRRRQAPAGASGMAQPWGAASANPAGTYAMGAYPPGTSPQPGQPGLGSTLGRGLATGLAVGAGVVAAEEIGRRMVEHHPQPPTASGVLPESERGLLDPGVNGDMGGQDFGIDDAGSWDGGGGSDLAGGDWDT